tara:strand:+ start:1779 stop:2297 length:519 start_codon:yes stop_codon:yes gene_type:complete
MKTIVVKPVNNSKYTADLYYCDKKIKCNVGFSGIGQKKKEGDGITPEGEYRFTSLFFRADKIKHIESKLVPNSIKKFMGWSTDSNDPDYNQLITLPTIYKHEKLYRNDDCYDIILVINYNISPTLYNKGSAIFVHCAEKKMFTEGCIAIKKEQLLEMLKFINSETVIKIKNF